MRRAERIWHPFQGHEQRAGSGRIVAGDADLRLGAVEFGGSVAPALRVGIAPGSVTAVEKSNEAITR